MEFIETSQFSLCIFPFDLYFDTYRYCSAQSLNLLPEGLSILSGSFGVTCC